MQPKRWNGCKLHINGHQICKISAPRSKSESYTSHSYERHRVTSSLDEELPPRRYGDCAFEIMTKETLVNSTSTMMNLSRFELRLLHFFDQFCVPLFSFGVNMTAEHMWRNCVPPLFAKSPLVRKAMFLFASMNMWPLCDVSTLFLADVQDARELYQIAPSWLEYGVESTMPVDLFDLSMALASTDNL